MPTGVAGADNRILPPAQVRHNLTFEEDGGKTKLTLQSGVIKTTPVTAAFLARMEEGENRSFDRLAQLLAKS